MKYLWIMLLILTGLAFADCPDSVECVIDGRDMRAVRHFSNYNGSFAVYEHSLAGGGVHQVTIKCD